VDADGGAVLERARGLAHRAGVSFRSVHDPARRLAWTVLSNTTDGAPPVARRLRDALGG
jgi:hypothetical protein